MNTPFSATVTGTLRRTAALAWAAIALATMPAQAGRPCDEQPQQAGDVARGLQLAERTARALDATGAQVLLLARAGQDLRQYGLRWSHLGLVYRESPPASPEPAPAEAAEPTMQRTAWRQPVADAPAPRPEAAAPGVWRVVHKLNHCGSGDAAVYRQGLGEFFMDKPYRYEAAYAVLAPELQAKLLPLLKDNDAVARLHEPRYSMVAYPWATTYQQSNQWAVETLAIAAEGVRTRTQAQAWLQLRGYEPTVLKLGPLTRLGARMTAANVAFDDHPNEKRFADRIETTTVDSVFAWLPRAGLAQTPVGVR